MDNKNIISIGAISTDTAKRMGTIVILQERMCGWLQYNGFHKIAEKQDLKNPLRKIFIFKDTPELRDTMRKYTKLSQEVLAK